MPKEQSTRPPKLPNVLKTVQDHVRKGRIIDTRHSKTRAIERLITFAEIIQVLEQGRHEKVKDEWKPEHKAWNYSIRGKTLDGLELRVPVFFDNKDPSMSHTHSSSRVGFFARQSPAIEEI